MTAATTKAAASVIETLRRRPRTLARAVVAIAALAAAGCGAAGSHVAGSRGSAPACLPTTLDHSAKLAGIGVDVSPAPGTGTANPHTQISFLGVPAAEIGAVSVAGGRSGAHPGSLLAYSQGDGASFVPGAPFVAGERVTVRASIGPAGARKTTSFGFRVDTPSSTAAVGGYPNPLAAPADYQSFDTLPGVQAPVLTVTAADRDPSAGDIFVTNGPGPGSYGPLIYTPQGRLVWFSQLSGGTTAEDLRVQTYDGRRDLTFWRGKVLSLGFGQGEDVVMDSRYRTVVTVRGGNGLQADLHEFQLEPHDIAYITAYNTIRCDLIAAGGARDGVITDSAMQAIDVKTGLVRWEWHSLDHVGVGEAQTSPPSAFPWDWFHLNSIDLEPDGNILISARNTWAAYQLQAGSGEILWRLGGLKSSFQMGPGTATAWQHDARMLANGDITMFDDGLHRSRAVRIAIDLKARRARLVSAYTHTGPPLLAASQGNTQTLRNGNTVVGFGGVPQISEYATGGSLRFDAHLSYEEIFYRAFRYPWSALPLSPPAAVAAANNTGEETIVHMSWNGATGVAAWRVLAGRPGGSLAPQTKIAATGFESSTILPRAFGAVAVQALDATGHLLGTSTTVAVKSFAASLPAARRSR